MLNSKVRYYEMLATMHFTSDRKRMSVLVRDTESQQIWLLCKGADSIIESLLSGASSEGQALSWSKRAVDEFAGSGLRTLMVASRKVSEAEFSAWSAEYDYASR